MSKYIALLWKLIDAVMAVLMAAMIVLVFTNVVLRYGFSSGLRPSIELSRLSFVWIVMLGAVVCLRNNEHLAVTEFSEAFLPRALPLIRRLIYLVIITCAGMLFWGSFKQTLDNWNNISQLTGLPTGLFYLVGIISGGLMVGVAADKLINPKDKEIDPKGKEMSE